MVEIACFYWECECELWNMTIVCAFRRGVSFVGVYPTGRDSSIMGKHLRCRKYTGERRSLEDTIVKKARLWLFKNLFVNFMCKLVLPCVLLCKGVVIKPLWTVFNYNLTCFK